MYGNELDCHATPRHATPCMFICRSDHLALHKEPCMHSHIHLNLALVSLVVRPLRLRQLGRLNSEIVRLQKVLEDTQDRILKEAARTTHRS